MRTALFTLAKDEDDYIKEYVDYYLALGFDGIYIYQNNYRTKAIEENEKVHLVEYDGECPQMTAMNHFIDRHWNEYDFAAFFDVDEFLLLKKHNDIHSFLEEYLDIPCIGINMRLFGDSNLKFDGKNCSVIERFNHSDSALFSLIKVIVNFRLCKNLVRISNPHIPCVFVKEQSRYLPLLCVDPNKTKATGNGNFYDNREDELAELAHFRNKTYEECYKRKFRNTDVLYGYLERVTDPFSGRTNINVFNEEFANHNKNDILNTSIQDFWKKISNAS